MRTFQSELLSRSMCSPHLLKDHFNKSNNYDPQKTECVFLKDILLGAFSMIVEKAPIP